MLKLYTFVYNLYLRVYRLFVESQSRLGWTPPAAVGERAAAIRLTGETAGRAAGDTAVSRGHRPVPQATGPGRRLGGEVRSAWHRRFRETLYDEI